MPAELYAGINKIFNIKYKHCQIEPAINPIYFNVTKQNDYVPVGEWIRMNGMAENWINLFHRDIAAFNQNADNILHLVSYQE